MVDSVARIRVGLVTISLPMNAKFQCRKAKIDGDMGNRIDERGYADHPSHIDERRPAEYGRCRCDRQRHQQDNRRPYARPVGQATERDCKDPVVSDADQIGGADRR
jgi:hypothetical protein